MLLNEIYKPAKGMESFTLDQLKQELSYAKRDYKEAKMAGEDEEVLDDLEADIEHLEKLIDDKLSQE